MSKETKTKTGGIVSAVILVLAVVLAMVVCIQVLTRGYVTIAGNSLFRVVTGSMEPTMPVGSILICRDTPIDDIREGDIVCFRSMGSAGVGKIITHRVVAVLQNGDGDTLLETRVTPIFPPTAITSRRTISSAGWSGMPDRRARC